MGSVSDRIKSVMFKPVPGGWVYRAPNPWVFGDTPHYFVKEAQKAQIDAIIVPRRPVLFAAVLVAGIIAWVAAVATIIWAFGSGHDDPSASDLVAMIVLIVFPMLAAVPFAAWIQRRRLQPILAGLLLTDERITYADMRQRAETASTLKQSLIACIASVFACFAAIGAALVHLVVKHSGFDGTLILWTVSAIFWGYVAVVWYRRTLRKAGEMQQHAAATTLSAQQNPVAPARFVRLSQFALLASSLAMIGVAGFILQRELSGQRSLGLPDYAMARVQYEKAAAAGNAA